MDDMDRKPLILTAANPSMHSRELADWIGISRQAVDCRMQELKKLGVVQKVQNATANIFIVCFDTVPRRNPRQVEEPIRVVYHF
jgi:predicted transcriptional regulator